MKTSPLSILAGALLAATPASAIPRGALAVDSACQGLIAAEVAAGRTPYRVQATITHSFPGNYSACTT